GNLQKTERTHRMVLDVTRDKNDVQSKHHGAAKDDRIAAIQAANAFGWNRQEIKARHCGQRAPPNPWCDSKLAKSRQNNRNDHHARSGDEGGFRGRRKLQSGGLKRVAAEHEQANLRSGPNCLQIDLAQRSPETIAITSPDSANRTAM